MGRARASSRRNWPDYLHRRIKGEVAFYFYRGPARDKDVHLGRDFEAVRRAVSVINGRTAADPVQIALAKIERPLETVGKHIEWYKERIDAKRSKRGKALAAGTLYEYKRILDDIGQRLVPARSIADVDRRAVASILDNLPGWTSNRYRQLLRDLFRHAVARGLREDNPVEATIAKDAAARGAGQPFNSEAPARTAARVGRRRYRPGDSCQPQFAAGGEGIPGSRRDDRGPRTHVHGYLSAWITAARGGRVARIRRCARTVTGTDETTWCCETAQIKPSKRGRDRRLIDDRTGAASSSATGCYRS